jgi:hypothetical protein
MGACCAKQICKHDDDAMHDARDRTILILHAYHDLPENAKGHYTRKRRGSFVLIEHESPVKKLRTDDMIACLKEFIITPHDKN